MTTDVDIGVKVTHGCGLSEWVTETKAAQTLGGTAGEIAARHEAVCGNKGECGFNWTTLVNDE